MKRLRLRGAGHRRAIVAASILVLALGAAGCGGGGDSGGGSGGTGGSESSQGTGNLSGTIRIDGSSVVAPLTEAVAEGFEEANPGVSVSVGTVGTGAGFEKLCSGRIDIGDAAWVMDPRARGLCGQAGVAYTRVPVAVDALAVLINSDNPVNCLTEAQLDAIWDPASTITSWDEIPELKEEFDEELALFVPDAGSNTFEHFTETTDGVAGGSRTDYKDVGEDPGAMVAAVAGATGSMGYLNLFSFLENEEDAVKALAIDSGKGCVTPSVEAAQDGSYGPLSRPVFLYLSDAAMKKPEVGAFVDYYLENVSDVAESARFVPLTEEQLAESGRLTRKVRPD